MLSLTLNILFLSGLLAYVSYQLGHRRGEARVLKAFNASMGTVIMTHMPPPPQEHYEPAPNKDKLH